jgi:hypothetical protein
MRSAASTSSAAPGTIKINADMGVTFTPTPGPLQLRLRRQPRHMPDESIVGQHRSRCLQGANWILRVAERLQE